MAQIDEGFKLKKDKRAARILRECVDIGRGFGGRAGSLRMVQKPIFLIVSNRAIDLAIRNPSCDANENPVMRRERKSLWVDWFGFGSGFGEFDGVVVGFAA